MFTARARTRRSRRQLVTELVRMYEDSDGTKDELNTIAVSLAVEAGDQQAETLLLILSDERLSEEMRHWIACTVLRERALADGGCYRQPAAEVVAAAREVLEGHEWPGICRRPARPPAGRGRQEGAGSRD